MRPSVEKRNSGAVINPETKVSVRELVADSNPLPKMGIE
jgi:hypothetical protein